MADNTTLSTMSGGDVISTDDVGSGVKVQRVKAQWGPDGTGTDVDVASGLPVQSGWKELTGSASAINADLVSADVSGYRWVSVQTTGTFSANLSFQHSNDNTTWYTARLMDVTQVGTVATNATAVGLFGGPIASRYFRVRTTAYTSGTPAVVVELTANPSSSLYQLVFTSNANVTVTASGTVPADASTNAVSALPVSGYAVGYNGASWDRLRVPNTFKTASATASGSTAVWTPGASKKFRLMRFKLDVTQDAAQSSGGDITLTFVDSASNMAIVQSVFVPGTAATTMGSGWTSGWVDLGNGILSSTINNVLNVSLSAALTSGAVRVLTAGTEE